MSAARPGPDRVRRRAAVTIGVVLLATVSPASRAQDAGSSLTSEGSDLYGYSGTATADALRVVLFADDYILTDRLVDVGIPTTQAVIDGTQSVAYAAAPDPGDLVLSAPGIVAQATGVSGLVPNYPLAVRSDTSSPTAQLGANGLLLKADTSPISAEARATIGGVPGEPAVGRIESHATSKLDANLNRMQVDATSTVDGFEALGGLLRIGRVQSRASAHQDQGGEVVRSAAFEVQGISVLGLPISVDQDGIDLAGNKVPLPIGETVQSLLDASGLGLRMLKPTETPNGIISGGLQITQEVNGLPNAAGPAVVTITLGRTAAFVTGPSDEPPPSDVSGVPTDTGGGLVDPPIADIPSSGALDPSLSGPVSTPVGSPPSVGPAQKIVAVETRGLSGVYLVLIAAAGLVAAAGSLFRRLAVRSPWT